MTKEKIRVEKESNGIIPVVKLLETLHNDGFSNSFYPNNSSPYIQIFHNVDLGLDKETKQNFLK